jgi:hypothetical protein
VITENFFVPLHDFLEDSAIFKAEKAEIKQKAVFILYNIILDVNTY